MNPVRTNTAATGTMRTRIQLTIAFGLVLNSNSLDGLPGRALAALRHAVRRARTAMKDGTTFPARPHQLKLGGACRRLPPSARSVCAQGTVPSLDRSKALRCSQCKGFPISLGYAAMWCKMLMMYFENRVQSRSRTSIASPLTSACAGVAGEGVHQSSTTVGANCRDRAR